MIVHCGWLARAAGSVKSGDNMPELAPPRPSQHRILIVNDDGIEAPGIKLLEEFAREISDDVWVVAPDEEKSGFSHSISMTIPVRVRQIDERHFAVRGTPTDCALLAIHDFMGGPQTNRAALRRQPRRQSGRGHHLFRDRRRRDGGRAARRPLDCAEPGVHDRRRGPLGDGAPLRARYLAPSAELAIGSRGASSTSISPIARPRR